MNQDNLCSIIAEKYYKEIYSYCYVKLNFDENAAKDCTQDVFLILIKKKYKLDLSGNIRYWLYKTADKVIKHYWRKEKKQKNRISIDDIEIIDDGGFPTLERDQKLDCLTDEEYKIICEYYNSEYGKRNELARKYGMTIYELYKEIDRIKKKIKSS